MKKTDIEKSLGAKINSKMNENTKDPSFRKDAGKPVDKREQRKIDQSKGLVPFAVKINMELVQKIQTLADEKQISVSDITADLLRKGLESAE